MNKLIFFLIIAWCTNAFSTPYPLENKINPNNYRRVSIFTPHPINLKTAPKGYEVSRIQVKWNNDETFQIEKLIYESSGTTALLEAKKHRDPLGSYQAELKTSNATYYDSIGTGKEFRKLARSLTFRFPRINEVATFTLKCENPITGKMETKLNLLISPKDFERIREIPFEYRLLQEDQSHSSIEFVIYSEGYNSNQKEKFFKDATKIISILNERTIPGSQRFNISAVFSPSIEALGKAIDFGKEPVKRNSFLGLYFPHWDKFGRWYNVLYATDQNQLRTAFGQVPYDYPFVLVNSNDYWGVGNYKEFTAIPSDHSAFRYLLIHEFGHFLGLNEEYEENGRTELEFAPDIHEPWSQNITFHPEAHELKWIDHVNPKLSLPTPRSEGGSADIGAYLGGYAGSSPKKSHKPNKSCIMNNGYNFCKVCLHEIEKQFSKDTGE